MKQYAILANPGHNRIYFDTAMSIAFSELSAITGAYDIELLEIGESEIGLPACICFRTENELTQEVIKAIGTSSIYYALFEIVEGGLLKPIKVEDFTTFPESMTQILKYNGKTNEQFTRLMVNLAISACKTGSKQPKLLDPMCGKGTTLYEGLIRGLDVVGVEIDAKWVNEIETFIVRFMKTGKYKHRIQTSKIAGPNGKKMADSFTLTAAVDKNDFLNGDFQTMQLYSADTRSINLFLKKKSCDMIVSDLPYGVQHGSKSQGISNMDRSPLWLLQVALVGWHNALKTKGSIVLSFNEFTMKREELAKLMEEKGFKVLDEEPYINYLHRVDQSINRNIIVAVKA
ncbi:MAG: TRM11 family SAM-dependent methyltransferase [Sarcina sp.]